MGEIITEQMVEKLEKECQLISAVSVEVYTIGLEDKEAMIKCSSPHALFDIASAVDIIRYVEKNGYKCYVNVLDSRTLYMETEDFIKLFGEKENKDIKGGKYNV